MTRIKTTDLVTLPASLDELHDCFRKSKAAEQICRLLIDEGFRASGGLWGPIEVRVSGRKMPVLVEVAVSRDGITVTAKGASVEVADRVLSLAKLGAARELVASLSFEDRQHYLGTLA